MFGIETDFGMLIVVVVVVEGCGFVELLLDVAVTDVDAPLFFQGFKFRASNFFNLISSHLLKLSSTGFFTALPPFANIDNFAKSNFGAAALPPPLLLLPATAATAVKLKLLDFFIVVDCAAEAIAANVDDDEGFSVDFLSRSLSNFFSSGCQTS